MALISIRLRYMPMVCRCSSFTDNLFYLDVLILRSLLDLLTLLVWLIWMKSNSCSSLLYWPDLLLNLILLILNCLKIFCMCLFDLLNSLFLDSKPLFVLNFHPLLFFLPSSCLFFQKLDSLVTSHTLVSSIFFRTSFTNITTLFLSNYLFW